MLEKFWSLLYRYYWDVFWSATISAGVVCLLVCAVSMITASGEVRSCYIKQESQTPGYYNVMMDMDWRPDESMGQVQTLDEAEKLLKLCPDK